MPENLRAYIVVAAISVVVLSIVRSSARSFISAADFRRWAFLWFAVTTIGFFAPDFWLMLGAIGLLIIVALHREPARPALFLLLLCALPMEGTDIPGFGIINYLFTINLPLTLSLVILLPVLLFVRRQDGERGLALEDILLLSYLVLLFVLNLRETTFTDSMRRAFMFFVSAVLPFLVLSRYIAKPADIRRAMLAFVIPVLILAPIGVFETVKYWSLYSSLGDVWGLSLSSYTPRSGLLRAVGPALPAGPIVFGSLFVVAGGFMIALTEKHFAKRQFWLGNGAIWSALLATLSRGPWVGAAVVYLVYWMVSPAKVERAIRYGLPPIFLGLILLATPFGARVWNLLPFIGTLASETIGYRALMWDVSTDVISRYPLFGHVAYRELPAMQVLVQGQGIIDIVNTYVGVALEYGLAGLTLFVGFFFVILRKLRRAYRAVGLDRKDEARRARALFATMVGLLVTIATVSSVGLIPWLYWSVAGLCVAQTRMLQRKPEPEKKQESSKTNARRKAMARG